MCDEGWTEGGGGEGAGKRKNNKELKETVEESGELFSLAFFHSKTF